MLHFSIIAFLTISRVEKVALCDRAVERFEKHTFRTYPASANSSHGVICRKSVSPIINTVIILPAQIYGTMLQTTPKMLLTTDHTYPERFGCINSPNASIKDCFFCSISHRLLFQHGHSTKLCNRNSHADNKNNRIYQSRSRPHAPDSHAGYFR